MSLKTYKLKNKDLKTPATLIRAVKAFNDNQAYPEKVYISKKDYNTLRKNTEKAYKKQTSYRLNKTKLEYYVAMELLNLGPNQTLSDIIKPGYVVVES